MIENISQRSYTTIPSILGNGRWRCVATAKKKSLLNWKSFAVSIIFMHIYGNFQFSPCEKKIIASIWAEAHPGCWLAFRLSVVLSIYKWWSFCCRFAPCSVEVCAMFRQNYLFRVCGTDLRFNELKFEFFFFFDISWISNTCFFFESI